MKSDKVTLPPIFGVGEHEKHTLEFGFDGFEGEKAEFFVEKWKNFEVLQVSRQRVENWVKWVKKSTSRKSTQKLVCDVGKPEKRVFRAF